jgi:RHS repeat-associated protein
VKATVSASSYSCSANRPERQIRKAFPACPRPGRHRSRGNFRKPPSSAKRAYPPQTKLVSARAQTCLEGPFGEVIRATGPMAKANPFRFSTKYQDDETDLLYYGYRYYNANTGRWQSRDPIGERGGKNLYCFTGNNQVNAIDELGNQTLSAHEGDVIYKRAISKTQVNYPKDGPACPCRVRNIGTVFLDAWLDADRNSSIEEQYPDDFNYITRNFGWDQGALERFKSPAYMGVGIALTLAPTKYQSTCCPTIRWKQVIKTPWYRRDKPDGSFTGLVYVDSPGGGVAQYFAGGGERYELSLICENPNFKSVVLAKWTWSWTFSLPANFTLTTPF